MAINPLIPMQAQTVDLGSAVSQGLNTYQNAQQNAMLREAAAQRKPLIEAQTQQAQQQVQSGKQDQFNDEQKSVIQGSYVAKQFLDSGDVAGTREYLLQRKAMLQELGLNTKQTDQGLMLLEQDPTGQKLKSVIDANVELGMQSGLFGEGQGVFAPQAAFDQQGNPVFIQGSKKGGISQLPGYRPYTPTLDEQTRAAIAKAQQIAPINVAEAGGKRAAEAAVDIQTKPQIEAAVTTAKETAKSGVDQAVTAKGNSVAMNVYETGMNNLLKALGDTTTGPVAGRIPAVTASQQIAEGAQAAMAPILKQMFRDAGEGTFTDRDQEMLIQMLPTREDHPEAAKAKIQGIDAIVRAKLSQPANKVGRFTIEAE